MQRWEYLFVNAPNLKVANVSDRSMMQRDAVKNVLSLVTLGMTDPQLPEFANQLGEEGWELVAVDGNNNYVFKRPKASTAPEPDR